MAIRILLLAFMVFALGACASQPESPFVQRLDDSTGESLLRGRQPLRLVAKRPTLSRVGKDYLFAMPVSVSGNSVSGTYLWFGFGSTTDRALTGAPLPDVSEVVLVVDGMPMTFDLQPWSAVAASEPFEHGVDHYASFGARVTRSQLLRIASAADLQAWVTNAKNRSPVYRMAAGDAADWASF